MSLNILITGITGFMGKFLTERYLKNGHVVYGNTYDETEIPPKNHPNLHLFPCDIRKELEVEGLVHESNPDIIFHLAAQSYPTKSWEDPITTLETNVNGTIHLFSSIMKKNLDPKVLVACSSAEYGHTAINENRSLREEDPLLPVHPYGLSKVNQDLISEQYFKKYGIKVYRARIFNTIGPGKKDDFVGDVSKQISEIKKSGKQAIIKVGNLETKRDMTDVRDQISALIALVENGTEGEAYNVCSGTSYQMGELLKKMITYSGLEIKFEKDPNKIRKIDEPLILGDPSKIREKCSWNQVYSIEKTLQDAINFW